MSSFDLSRTLPVGGGLAALCCFPPSSEFSVCYYLNDTKCKEMVMFKNVLVICELLQDVITGKSN